VSALIKNLIEDHRASEAKRQKMQQTRQEFLKRAIQAGHTIRNETLRVGAYRSSSSYRDAMSEVRKVKNELALIEHEISALGDDSKKIRCSGTTGSLPKRLGMKSKRKGC